MTLRLVMDHISSRLCITFSDVTQTFDRKDPKWFTSNGFETNSYMNIKTTNECASAIGQGTVPAPVKVTPCNGFVINLHEMFHAIGAIHTQQSPIRDRYLDVHHSLVRPEYASTYIKDTRETLVAEYFDPFSAMMYLDRTWHLTGQETYTPIRDDLFHTAPSFSEEHVLFNELNKIYRCNELFCNNDQTDCGPGYHTLINGRCRCVCPDELDYNTNYRTHIDGPSKNISWPDTQIILYGTKRCPTGFEPNPSSLPLSGRHTTTLEPMPEPYKIKDTTITILLCKKSTPVKKSDVNWSSWPRGGELCFVKPRGQDCGGVFLNGALEFETTEESHPVGDIGNITINGNIVRINYCCKDREHYGLITDLPNSEPFRLVAQFGECPVVKA
ncbi:protein SpAN-like [Physella acuta]|uniref:protein SpAN-like n=1 Tax=Physella acuta TaxID=109671 RepID=UPI0027DCB0DC|nr:protein SpAN-like [Physella acuta]